jgi:hypothetical protein
MAAERTHPWHQIEYRIVRQIRLIAPLIPCILPSNFKYGAENACPLDQTASAAQG